MKQLLTIFALFLAASALAQEGLKPLGGNLSYIYPDLRQPVKKAASPNPTLRPQSGSLSIPFIEDFFYAPTSPYPDPNKWEDSCVFINAGYPVSPPSVGVATFDGLNRHGYPYNPSLTNNIVSQAADTLTSKPINLLVTANSQTLQPSDSVALTFYYEPTGYGDSPDLNDSLILDLFSPTQNRWYNAYWYKNRGTGVNLTKTDTTFTRAFVWIDSTQFLQDGFRFRFRNSATPTGNFDHWHVDYIYLNKNRSQLADTVYDDLTFAYVPTPLLRDYASMPWEQYNASEMAPNNLVKIKNNSAVQVNMTYQYRIDTGNSVLYTYNGFANVLNPFRAAGYSSFTAHSSPPVGYTFAPMPDSVDYTIVHTMFQQGTTTDFVPGNDTLIQYQRFRNYYALDDGSAEAGYYLNAAGGKIAVKVNVNVTDSFLGARIYFDPVGSVNQANNSLGFHLCVWAAGSNGPGTLLFRDTIFKPAYYNREPAYSSPEFKLMRPKLLPPGTYYIGIQQLADIITIGFDRNVDHRGSVYYDSGAGWTKSQISGSVMIHPVFGRTLPHPVGFEELTEELKNSILVYPNPASDYLSVRSPAAVPLSYTLLNAMGQTLRGGTLLAAETSIDTGSLPAGIYFLIFKTGTHAVQQQKIIIQR